MPCHTLEFPDGSRGIVCLRGRKSKPCTVCRRRVGEKLCDGRIAGQTKTCDRLLCRQCAVHVEGQDLDFCPAHAPQAAREPAQPALL